MADLSNLNKMLSDCPQACSGASGILGDKSAQTNHVAWWSDIIWRRGKQLLYACEQTLQVTVAGANNEGHHGND